MYDSRTTSLGRRNSNNIKMIFLCLFRQFQLFFCEGEKISVAKQKSVMIFSKMCYITLSTITLRCPRPPFPTCMCTLVELSVGKRRLLLERVPLPKTQTQSFLFCTTTDATYVIIFGTIIHISSSLICLRRGFISVFFL